MTTSNTSGPRSGWGIVAIFAALHVLVVSRLRTRGEAHAGDPTTLWMGLGFLVWGVACVVAPRASEASILFRFLNRRDGAGYLAVVFLGMAAWLLATWVGVW